MDQTTMSVVVWSIYAQEIDLTSDQYGVDFVCIILLPFHTRFLYALIAKM